jgi:hypothetical protein
VAPLPSTCATARRTSTAVAAVSRRISRPAHRGRDLRIRAEPGRREALEHGQRAHEAIVASWRQSLAEPDETERALDERGGITAARSLREAGSSPASDRRREAARRSRDGREGQERRARIGAGLRHGGVGDGRVAQVEEDAIERDHLAAAPSR